MGLIDARLGGTLGLARALRLRHKDTSHTMQQMIMTRALKATNASNAGMNLAMVTSACEVSVERLNLGEMAAAESPV